MKLISWGRGNRQEVSECPFVTWKAVTGQSEGQGAQSQAHSAEQPGVGWAQRWELGACTASPQAGLGTSAGARAGGSHQPVLG